MRPFRSRSDVLIGTPLVILGMGLIAVGAINPLAMIGPEPFTPIILLILGTVLFLFGASYLRVQVVAQRFWRAWMPKHATNWLEQRFGRDRRLGERRLAPPAFDVHERRVGSERRRIGRRQRALES